MNRYFALFAFLTLACAARARVQEPKNQGTCTALVARYLCKEGSIPLRQDKTCITKLCVESSLEACCMVAKMFAHEGNNKALAEPPVTKAPTEPPTTVASTAPKTEALAENDVASIVDTPTKPPTTEVHKKEAGMRAAKWTTRTTTETLITEAHTEDRTTNAPIEESIKGAEAHVKQNLKALKLKIAQWNVAGAEYAMNLELKPGTNQPIKLNPWGKPSAITPVLQSFADDGSDFLLLQEFKKPAEGSAPYEVRSYGVVVDSSIDEQLSDGTYRMRPGILYNKARFSLVEGTMKSVLLRGNRNELRHTTAAIFSDVNNSVDQKLIIATTHWPHALHLAAKNADGVREGPIMLHAAVKAMDQFFTELDPTGTIPIVMGGDLNEAGSFGYVDPEITIGNRVFKNAYEQVPHKRSVVFDWGNPLFEGKLAYDRPMDNILVAQGGYESVKFAPAAALVTETDLTKISGQQDHSDHSPEITTVQFN